MRVAQCQWGFAASPHRGIGCRPRAGRLFRSALRRRGAARPQPLFSCDPRRAGDSSKPSDGLRTHFLRYGYKDQVRAQHLLLEKIGITHLKLVLGTSMGGMQTWLWGEMFPNDMDCLAAIASTPAAISGRNMIWREMISQAIRSDPAWRNGDYSKDSPPRNWSGSSGRRTRRHSPKRLQRPLALRSRRKATRSGCLGEVRNNFK